jgi:hypothetical protein
MTLRTIRTTTPARTGDDAIPPLENGDQLDQKTFHERYEAMPEGVKAELIGGIVYMASPLKVPHGRRHSLTIALLCSYEAYTPGVSALDNTTEIMGEESEPQPDGALLILPTHGGQAQINEDDYLVGAAELLSEVASSSKAIDLGPKFRDYQKAGVKEYVVVCLRPPQVMWFVRRGDKFEPLAPDAAGIFRSEVFPGLWLDGNALLNLDGRRVLDVLQQGLATPEHAAFVKKLADRAANSTANS